MLRISQFVAVLLLVVGFSSSSLSQTQPLQSDTHQSERTDERQVIAALKQFLANASDPIAHESFWTDDLVYVTSSGKLLTKSEVVTSVRAEAARHSPATNFTAEDITVRTYGSVSVVNFILVARDAPPVGPRHEGETRRYRNCGVFQHGRAGWQAVSWQSTFLPGPPKPE